MISLSDGIWGEFFGFLYFSVFLNLKFILKGVNVKAFMAVSLLIMTSYLKLMSSNRGMVVI